MQDRGTTGDEFPEAQRLHGLLREALAGTRGAEDAFFDVLVDCVQRLTRVITVDQGVDEEGAREIAQEVLRTFLRLLREDSEFLLKIRSWQGAIAATVWRRMHDQFRKRKQLKRLQERLEAEGYAEELEADEAVAMLAAEAELEAREKMLAEQWEKMGRFFEALRVPPLTREIFGMRARGMAFDEIGAALNMTVNACTLRYHAMNKKFVVWRSASEQGEAGR